MLEKCGKLMMIDGRWN